MENQAKNSRVLVVGDYVVIRTDAEPDGHTSGRVVAVNDTWITVMLALARVAVRFPIDAVVGTLNELGETKPWTQIPD